MCVQFLFQLLNVTEYLIILNVIMSAVKCHRLHSCSIVTFLQCVIDYFMRRGQRLPSSNHSELEKHGLICGFHMMRSK